jgi:hypothetical protein
MRMHTKLFAVLSIVVVAAATGAGAPAVAAERQRPTMNIRILNNSEFDREHGVTSGTGTKSNPYVISGLELNSLHIENTSKWVEIKKNTIAGTLLLDWIGGAKVHYNSIGTLVANRNVKRTGMPTTGSIVRNRIGDVQQLRHWDGVFAYNTVGNTKDLKRRAANMDGFNGAKYHNNTFYGFVDARLHGHHHSSGFGEESHMHSTHSDHHHAAAAVDHTQRYHQVSVTNNKIYSNADYALAWLDTGHAGNDRTAASETDEALNDPHAHHTRVRFAGNKLMGAGILVDVFNANDRRHLRTYKGSLEIDNNTITLHKDDFLSAKQLMGINMRNATDVTTRIRGNKITGWKPSNFLSFLERWDTNAGILLQNVDKADVWIVGNSVANRHFGVHAVNFTVSTRWFISKLKTSNVQEPVAYQNVPRKPQAA